jgi:GntR family transcriptional regulator
MYSTTVPLRADQRPLYIQASDALRALLAEGGYTPGARLPSETEMARSLGISRPTLREGLRLLEQEGMVVRRHGVGTFVSEARAVIDAGLEVLESLDRIAERRGLRTSMSDGRVEERLPTPRETEGLQLCAASVVSVITRVIEIADQPVAYLMDVLPSDVFPAGDLGSGFRGSVLDLLLARGWPEVSHSRTELTAEAADAEMARRLHVRRGAPLLRLEAQLFTQDGQVADFSVSRFVPGHLRFHVVRRIG